MDSYQARLEEWRKRTGVPAVAAAVRLDGSLLWHGVSQSTTNENSELISPRSRFPIYSITKTFTGVCILQLAQARQLNLGDSVARWMRNIPLPHSVTFRHLLQHTSGLRDYGQLSQYHQAVKNKVFERSISEERHVWQSSEQHFELAIVG